MAGFNYQPWLALIKASLTDAKGTAVLIKSDETLRRAAPTALIVITAIGTIQSVIMIALSDQPILPLIEDLAAAPLVFAFVQYIAFLLVIVGIVLIGRVFGGTGDFASTLTLMVWLQFLSLLAQLVLWPVDLLAPGLAGLASFILMFVFLWLTVVYIAAAHGFRSLPLVVLVSIGCLFVLSSAILIVLTSLGFLPEQPPNV